MAEKLVSMKLDPPARSTAGYPSEASGKIDAPLYPWGLEVTLDTAALEKLGLADKLPAVGSSLKLRALVDVTSVSENESQDGGRTCSVRLQITDLWLSGAVQDVDPGAIYGKGGKA